MCVVTPALSFLVHLSQYIVFRVTLRRRLLSYFSQYKGRPWLRRSSINNNLAGCSLGRTWLLQILASLFSFIMFYNYLSWKQNYFVVQTFFQYRVGYHIVRCFCLLGGPHALALTWKGVALSGSYWSRTSVPYMVTNGLCGIRRYRRMDCHLIARFVAALSLNCNCDLKKIRLLEIDQTVTT